MPDLSVTNRGSGWSCKFRRRLAAESYLGAVTLIFLEMKNVLDRITGLT